MFTQVLLCQSRSVCSLATYSLRESEPWLAWNSKDPLASASRVLKAYTTTSQHGGLLLHVVFYVGFCCGLRCVCSAHRCDAGAIGSCGMEGFWPNTRDSSRFPRAQCLATAGQTSPLSTNSALYKKAFPSDLQFQRAAPRMDESSLLSPLATAALLPH